MKKEVKLEKRTVIVEKLPLKKYAELLSALQQLPKHINGLDKLSNEDLIAELPSLIANSFDDIVSIFTVATELEKEEVENMGLDEATEVFLAIIEVNNYKSVYENIKKVLGSQKQGVKTNKTGTGGQ